MGEEGTVDRLLAAIRAAAGDETLEWRNEPTPLSGGFWAEMWKVSLTGPHLDKPLSGPLAARVMPEEGTAAWETAVQQHLASMGFATPAVRLSGAPGPELDRAWMLMDFHHGQPLLSGMSGLSALARLPTLIRDLPDQLARHAAALHRIDATSLIELVDIFDESWDVVGMLEHLAALADEADRRDLAHSAEILLDRRPTSDRPVVICHGDLHPFNILSRPDGDPEHDTVLDWSAARLADPLYDITYTHVLLSNPPLSGPAPIQAVVKRMGQLLAKRFVGRYKHHTDRPVTGGAAFNWFTAVHCLRMLIEVSVWEADDTLEEHPNHPFLTMQEVAAAKVALVVDRP